ncbi:GTPase [Propioniciclava sp.]|uniref:GTPase family protein n=1 Tax=Propioniciclava sp. TaxID=2038686 RepID=UPI00261C7331|nr:GTPase [Propioniciclava sp.]
MTQFFTESFRSEFDKQSGLMGRFNLGVFGKTGVGKSTLINAVFGEEVAATGVGAPITKDSHLYVGVHGSLGLIDTRGIEIGRDDKALVKEIKQFVSNQRKLPVADQMHAAWYCVRALDRRFEEAEAELIRTLADLDVPVILVFTQVPVRDGQFHPDALALAAHVESLNLPIVAGRPFMTYAMRDQFTGQPAYGLMELVNATFLVVPDAVHAALATAQRVDLDAKARQANKHIAASVAGAATAAAVPIPFSSAAILVPLQLGMMARIAQLYNVPFDRAAILAVASTSLATATGRQAATSLLELIPGAGQIAGGVINASVASGFTLAMGQAWLAVCQRAAAGKLDGINGVLDSAAVKRLFDEELRKRAPRVRRDETQTP